ncbi:MAG: hypothetical protein Q4D54_06320 [Eubacteriales bacterium]|nr:hypothetical protein [Eubacteriales bacterium]
MSTISVNRFVDFYGITVDDIASYDLQGMIDDYEIEEADLPARDWYRKLKNDARLGIQYGKNLNRIIRGEVRTLTEADDLQNVRYLAYEITKNVGDGLVDTYDVAIDVEKQTMFYNCNLSNINNCEKQIQMDKETLKSVMAVIDDMKLVTWNRNIVYAYEDGDYLWDLFLIMGKYDVIRYMGNVPKRDNDYEDRFDQIIQKVEKLVEE